MKKLSGIRAQLFRLLALATLCSVLLFCALYTVSATAVYTWFPDSALQTQMTQRRVEKLQAYISANGLTARDSEKLMFWCKKQPLVLMEVYRNQRLLFNSNYLAEDALVDKEIEVNPYDWYSYYELLFSDGTADILIYSDDSYLLRMMLTVASLLLSGIVYVAVILGGIKSTIKNIYALHDAVAAMGGGNFEQRIECGANNELGLLARGLNQMRLSILQHREQEQMLIKQNYDMVTSLSHDLRTPLTKLMLYAEIIKNKKYKDEQELAEHLERIYHKGMQIRDISGRLLQYTLSQASVSRSNIGAISFRQCFYDPLSEMVDYLALQGFDVRCHLEWPPDPILVVEEYISRLLDNLASNIVKYADINSPVMISTEKKDGYIGLTFHNNTGNVANAEGTNIGLTTVKMMMEQINGKSTVASTERTYEITLFFPISAEPC